jgi:iron complex transport system substrate-binding protein
MIHRLTAFVTLIVLLAACSGTPTLQTPSSLPAATEAPAAPAATVSAPAASAATFPVVIEHKYGSTQITQQPTRLVSVGFIDQDAILALGVVPVGIRDWYGDQPNATWPWAQDKLGGAQPVLLPADALNFEQIAALNPDLIIGISSGMTEQDYATLSQIAPTVAQSGEYIDYGVPWQEQTRVIGTALGRSKQAETLIADLEALFAEARTENPAFDGASGVVAVKFNNAYSAYGPQDVRGRLLESLGFAIPEELTSLAGTSFFASISNERLDLLDTDVLLWVVSTDAEREAIESDALYQQLNVARQGRAVFLDQQLSGAASFSSVLSLPFLLERLVPQLAAAVDGDPSTVGTATR